MMASSSTNRFIRRRSRLKYSKYGIFNWGKWANYDCELTSILDRTGTEKYRIELFLTDLSNVDDDLRGKRLIELDKIQSITSIRGNTIRNEPKDIIILKIDRKKHRLGFGDINDYNQWKSLLDSAYHSLNEEPVGYAVDDNAATVNMLYESTSAVRYRVHFADLCTRDTLCLPGDNCELIIDADKLVIEQNQDKQYTFARSTIRTMRRSANNEIEFELGTRAAIQGFIRFRFESANEAQGCYSQLNNNITPAASMRQPAPLNPRVGQPTLPPKIALQDRPSYRQLPSSTRAVSSRAGYPNSDLLTSRANVPLYEYAPFQSLV